MINLILKIKEILIAILIGFGAAFGIYQAGRNNAKKQSQLDNEARTNEKLVEIIRMEDKVKSMSDDDLNAGLR